MVIHKKTRRNPAQSRGRFVFCRAFGVLHIYRRREGGDCQLVASIEGRGGRGQVKLRDYQRNPMEIRNGLEALQLLRMMRRYA